MPAASKCIDVAPQGDLIVCINSGSLQKLSRISSTIIKLASPVFRTMLGPSFKEGQTTHDSANPLKLPDDDATAMLNLFHVLHYNSDKADKTETDWVQRLVIVCDKYRCTESLKAYVRFEMDQSSSVSTLDRLIISGLMGDRERFETMSEKVVRMPTHQAKFAAHKDILRLSPPQMLDRMRSYRHQARNVYRDNILLLAAKIVYSDYLVDNELCLGLQKRLAVANETFRKEELLLLDNKMDCYLPNMRALLTRAPFYESVEHADIDYYTCEESCTSCEERVGDIARDIAYNLMWGTKEHCKGCLECFQARKFKFTYECTVHSKC